jgi:nitrate/nitrite-specific signal transduction histidine kinase
LNWELREECLNSKEKVELYASIREALLNVTKHAEAQQVWINCKEEIEGWSCLGEDDGKGYEADPFE